MCCQAGGLRDVARLPQHHRGIAPSTLASANESDPVCCVVRDNLSDWVCHTLANAMRHAHLWVTIALVGLPLVGRAGQAPAQDPRALTVVSLNLALREDADRIADELLAIGAAQAADLILLQEVVKRDAGPDVAWRLAQRLGLDSVYHASFRLGEQRSAGLAFLSRQPPPDLRLLRLRRFELSFRSRDRIALGAAVETPSGTIHVYNVHLDTRINLAQRLDQLAAVTRDLDALEGPVIVGGDFNTNDNRWLFHTIPLPFIGRQASGLVRFMEERGFRSAFGPGRPTHDALGMRLDWMFLRGLRASARSIQPVPVSDHHALIVSVVPTRRDLMVRRATGSDGSHLGHSRLQ